MLVNSLCVMAFIRSTHSVETEKSHQGGPRMPMARRVPSANRATL